jgi:hypothetical protein
VVVFDQPDAQRCGRDHALERIGTAAVCDRVIRSMAFAANPGTARRITARIKRMK